MTYAPTKPLDVPPYQLQPLIASISESSNQGLSPTIQARCAQALGSEVYVGCSNGELLRFAIQGSNTGAPDSYTLLSRQKITHERPVQELVLLPSLAVALILADHQVYFYKLPFLEMIPPTIIKPIRNVVTIAVDVQHLRRPLRSDLLLPAEHVEFCVIKRNAIGLYGLRERLFFQKEIPLPEGVGAVLARRTGRALCIADKEYYNIIDLEAASILPVLPVNQAAGDSVIKPSITVISETEFLILSWTGGNTLGVFITGDGDPVRGTLEWPSYPESVSLDYPYITTLLPNNTIEIHSVETQAIVQVIPAPATSPGSLDMQDRKRLVSCANGFLIPSSQRSDKLRRIPVRLLRRTGTVGEGERSR